MWSLIWELTKYVHEVASKACWDFMFWSLDCVGIDLGNADFSGFGGGGGDGGG